MSWNLQMDSPYVGGGAPYHSSGSFMDFFAGLTYDHVNFIFSDSSSMQENTYSPVSTGYYKFGYSDSGGTQYYTNNQPYEVYDQMAGIHGYSGRHTEFPLPVTNERTTATNQQSDRTSNRDTNITHRDCPRSQHNSQDYQAVWQDNVDPDTMTYEELLELGEAVGAHSRGLSQEQISLLPVSKFRCCFLFRKKSRSERCVICQMEYRRGERQITLPCKHKYHVCCGTKWLNINKACPICYTEVFVDARNKF